jgi:transketolase C-terminal domain/subunit
MDKDPRPIIEALGIDIIETPSLHDTDALYAAYREARVLSRAGHPNLIYPTGYGVEDDAEVDLTAFADRYGIAAETATFAAANEVPMSTKVWVPGALMSYRDVECMLECVFKVNGLPGGKHHHDGHMKGRDCDAVLANPMLQLSAAQADALAAARAEPARSVVTAARPAAGSPNLAVADDVAAAVSLPGVGSADSARAGVEAGYQMLAAAHPDKVFVVSCDLDASTKLGKARAELDDQHQFELSIEEQLAAILANGLAVTSARPQLNVFSTFAAFFEGIAREGLEMWRYQRNLNGANEGLNVTYHMSHVGACTGRDHFSGWSLDWITLALGYLPYLHRFYAPADARAAFVAVRDLGAHYGAHLIGIPRDKLPILDAQDGSPLYDLAAPWAPVTAYRQYDNASRAILALGAPAYLGGEAAATLAADGVPTDVYVINGLPFGDGELAALLDRYSDGVVTIEDGIIATPETGLRGFAGMVASAAGALPHDHVGIVDPRIAPAHGHDEVWEHFGLTAAALEAAVRGLSSS